MGTQLAARGAIMGGHSNILNPEIVYEIHKDYSESGCHILTTNTLTMNRIFIESHNLKIDVREVNLRGVELAKQAKKSGQYLLGDISSTGKLLVPYGELEESKAYDAFAEQASILLEGGVDGFIIETMPDLNEAKTALQACRSVSPLPVFVSISFSIAKDSYKTIMGNSPQQCATELSESGAFAVGANCGTVDPHQISEIVSMMKQNTKMPVFAQPNAGKPEMINGETKFNLSPADFLAGIKECIKAGSQIIGGCCGTTPEHIRIVHEYISSN
ncbi:MAG: homocysteine S-methyltransferase family protein [Spirochaetes bacterium]|nr:homocysteine S-methyltransferase family protein [Spirochaetota bacterium]